MKSKTGIDEHAKYGCYLIRPSGGGLTTDLPRACTIWFNNNMTSKMLDFLKTPGLEIIDDNVSFPTASRNERIPLAFIREVLHLGDEAIIQSIIPLDKIDDHPAGFMKPLLEEVMLSQPNIRLQLGVSLAEMSKTPNAQHSLRRKAISEDINRDTLAGHMKTLSERILLHCPKNPRDDDDVKLMGEKPFDVDKFYEEFQKAFGRVMEGIYAHILTLVSIITSNMDLSAPLKAADLFESYLEKSEKITGETPFLEVTLALCVLGKQNRRAILKAAALNGDISAIRNAAWDVSQFSLFKIMASVLPTSQEFFFATGDQGLAALAERYSRVKENPTEVVKELVNEFLQGLSWGASPKEVEKINESLVKMATKKSERALAEISELKRLNLNMEMDLINRKSRLDASGGLTANHSP